MNIELVQDVSVILFLIVVIVSFGVLMYNLFNNTPYPEELTDIMDVPITDPQDLTQLTLQYMQDNEQELSNGYRLPPPNTKYQCLLPSLRQ